MAKVRITQVREPDRPERAASRHAARSGLGTDRPLAPSTTESPVLAGMLRKVRHLVKVEEA